MLIVADPQGDLLAAAREGKTIHEDLAGEAERLRIDLRYHRVGTASVKTALGQYNVLHYAGHADYDLQDPAQSGWRLADGKLTAQDVLQLGAAAAMPALVFCNACQSGQTQAWTFSQEAEQSLYGLANAFLLAGAQHYIGSFWEIPDQPSSSFAIAFYRALAQGTGVGEALRRARQALAERYGEESVVWASYVLYGDPTCRYLEAMQEELLAEPEPVVAETVTRGESRPRQRRTALWGLGVGALLALALLAVLLGPQWWTRSAPPPSPLSIAYQALDQGEPDKAKALLQQQVEAPEPRTRSQAYTGLAAIALASGDYQRALDFAAQAETADADIGYSHVIRGHIFLNQGKTAEALAAYRTAITKPHTLPWQQAIAYDRLGRLYAAQGDTAKALEHYDKATTQHRDLAVVHANKAHLLDKLGKHQEALDLYRQALQLSPDDPVTTLLLRDAERRQQLAHDREQQQRIDQLVDELVRAYREDPRPAAPEDEWTSRPLTVAFLPFQHQEALSARAGEAEFIILSLTQALRDSGRVTVVEREVLDKVLTELKLSAADIVNAPQALRKGKFLAARLLATGSLSRFGQMGLLSVRLIETETTMINAAVSQFVERPDEVIGIMQRVSQNVLHEIRRTYPLQGRIVRLTPQGEVVLDIGAQHGMTPGLVLQVFDSEMPVDTDTRVIPAPVGRIEVTQVTGQLSQARVLEQLEPFEPGRKVREVVAQ
jgi:tetratricopeptide (TPR) repeat protein